MKKIVSYSAFLAAIITLNSCGNSSNTNESSSKGEPAAVKLNQLTNNPKADKLHFYFQLDESSQTDSSIIYQANSLFESDTVGLQIEVLKTIAPGITSEGKPNEETGFSEGPIKFSSIGEHSDSFVKSLAKLFNVPSSG